MRVPYCSFGPRKGLGFRGRLTLKSGGSQSPRDIALPRKLQCRVACWSLAIAKVAGQLRRIPELVA